MNQVAGHKQQCRSCNSALCTGEAIGADVGACLLPVLTEFCLAMVLQAYGYIDGVAQPDFSITDQASIPRALAIAATRPVLNPDGVTVRANAFRYNSASVKPLCQ